MIVINGFEFGNDIAFIIIGFDVFVGYVFAFEGIERVHAMRAPREVVYSYHYLYKRLT